MKKEQALQIAHNFFTYREGGAPYDMILKKVDGDRFIIRASSLTTDEVVYEIEIDPASDEIVMKEIVAKYKVSEFTQQPRMLSGLKSGDCFRKQDDWTVYEFWKPTTVFGETCFLIAREGGSDADCISDVLVYPIGK